MATITETVTTTRGLCSACKHEAGCIYPKSQEQVVLECGQFELAQPVQRTRDNRGQEELEKLWKESSPPATGTKFQGLCASCADRDVCIYPKPDGGVWRCEEYR
jgi:hypothetical protein